MLGAPAAEVCYRSRRALGMSYVVCFDGQRRILMDVTDPIGVYGFRGGRLDIHD